MIRKLVMKDLSLVKRNISFAGAIVFGLMWGIAGVSAENLFLSLVFQGSSMLFIVLFMVISVISYDEKSSADIMFNSLPVKRYDLVAAKYLSTLGVTLFSCFLIYIATNIMSLLLSHKSIIQYPASMLLVVFIISISLIYYGIYFPMHYYSIGRAKVVNSIIYFLLIIIPNVAKKISGKIIGIDVLKQIKDVNFWVIGIVLLIASAGFYCFSYNISMKIYTNKEF